MHNKTIERGVNQGGSDELSRLIVQRVEAYEKDLEGTRGLPLHEMIIAATERPLFQWAMQRYANNQKAAAKILGINRNTLHKKLIAYGLLSENI